MAKDERDHTAGTGNSRAGRRTWEGRRHQQHLVLGARTALPLRLGYARAAR